MRTLPGGVLAALPCSCPAEAKATLARARFLLHGKEVVTIPDLVVSCYTEYYRLNNKGEKLQGGTVQSHQVVGKVRPSGPPLK